MTRWFWCAVAVVVLGCSSAEKSVVKPSAGPGWARGAVWYQIFPERFRNGDPQNDPQPGDTEFENYPGWQVTPWTADWYKLQPWEQTSLRSHSEVTTPGGAHSKNFYDVVFARRYGGDVQGVIDKLDYLQQLGITAIYFNPLFEAKSLHKYDASSYHHIDDNFGPDPAGDKRMVSTETEDPATWKWTGADTLFLGLLREAHRRNLRVIIDGVWNHVGRDFWAFRDLLKNQQSSPYKDWFVVRRWDDPATPKDEFDYQSWWDSWTLPVFREDSNGIVHGPREHIFAATRRWMDPNGDGDLGDGIDGWRLDVSKDVSPKFWVEWCALVRSINPQAYTVGEIWEEAPEWLAGDRYDAVMNYPVAYAMKNFFINRGRNWTPEQFDQELRAIRANYGNATNQILQVLIDSHDTDRIASQLRNPNRDYDRNVSLRDDPTYDPRRPTAEQRRLQQILAAFHLTYVGASMIYYGSEAGMWGGDDPDDRKPMVWPDLVYENETYTSVSKFTDSDPVAFDHELFEYYRKLIAIHNRHRALQVGDFTAILTEGQVYGYRRAAGQDTVIVVLNNGDTAQDVEVPGSRAMVTDEMTGATYSMTNGMVRLTLPAKAAAILTGGEAGN